MAIYNQAPVFTSEPATHIDRIRAFALRAEVSFGPSSALAEMPVRNALLVELTTSEGIVGWGEIWCNFPPRGNEARLMLLEDVIAPRLIGSELPQPGQIIQQIEGEQLRMIIHTAEPGAYGACLAGLDTCIHDIAAQRAGMPLSRYLSKQAAERVDVYASTPSFAPLDVALPFLRKAGHRTAKLKIGYDRSTDIGILRQFAEHGRGMRLCVDANQAWDLQQAEFMCDAIQEFGPEFIEEPLLATEDHGRWRELSKKSPVPIAAGENIVSPDAFERMMKEGDLTICQPDVAKWGGVSGAWQVCSMARSNGARTFAHYMGSAVGLAASLHVIAADARDGMVELDANENPLRTELSSLNLQVREGSLACPRGPGLGLTLNQEVLERYSVLACELHA